MNQPGKQIVKSSRERIDEAAALAEASGQTFQNQSEDVRGPRTPSENVIEAARNLRYTTLAWSSHRSTCSARGGGCTDDGEECEVGGELWMNETRATFALWKALDALDIATQKGEE